MATVKLLKKKSAVIANFGILDNGDSSYTIVTIDKDEPVPISSNDATITAASSDAPNIISVDPPKMTTTFVLHANLPGAAIITVVVTWKDAVTQKPTDSCTFTIPATSKDKVVTLGEPAVK
jgi:hypothetical protein